MFSTMRRKDREVTGSMIEEILLQGEFGTLATISENGYPYTVPLSYVYYDKAIFFHCAKQGHKLNNIQHNNKVSFSIVTDVNLLPSEFVTNYKSVIAFGEASEVTGDVKEAALGKLIEKYSAEFIPEGNDYIKRAQDNTTVIKIDIHHLTGKVRA